MRSTVCSVSTRTARTRPLSPPFSGTSVSPRLSTASASPSIPLPSSTRTILVSRSICDLHQLKLQLCLYAHTSTVRGLITSVIIVLWSKCVINCVLILSIDNISKGFAVFRSRNLHFSPYCGVCICVCVCVQVVFQPLTSRSDSGGTAISIVPNEHSPRSPPPWMLPGASWNFSWNPCTRYSPRWWGTWILPSLRFWTSWGLSWVKLRWRWISDLYWDWSVRGSSENTQVSQGELYHDDTCCVSWGVSWWYSTCIMRCIMMCIMMILNVYHEVYHDDTQRVSCVSWGISWWYSNVYHVYHNTSPWHSLIRVC